VRVATEAVRKNHATAKATQNDIEKEVKEWLKFAKERDTGRQVRNQRRRLVAAGRSPAPAEDDSE